MTRASSRFRAPVAGLAAVACAIVFAGEALAAPAVLPTGGKVAVGAAKIGTPAGFSLTIDQTSPKAIIDWTSFSIGHGGKVTFDNGSGITLNRVMGGQVSDIDGTLFATGGVYILNPNGVVIGKNGVVNVGGDFVASSLALSNQAFLSGGDLAFVGAAADAVTNHGYIVSASGDVDLIGPQVANAGKIDAARGDVGLAAGEAVVLRARDSDEGRLGVLVGGAGTSAENTGLIRSAEAELKANGGDIYALAVKPGTGIEATGVRSKDGNVWLVADGGDLTVTGRISAHRADGAGGLVETSGESVAFGGVRVDAGEWLVDPVTLTIDAPAAATISLNLATTNVVLQTTASSASGFGVQAAGAGDIIVAAPIGWSSGKSLTLDAYHSVAFDANVTVYGGGQVILKTNDGGTGGDFSFGYGDSLAFASQGGEVGGGSGVPGQALTINGQTFTLVYTEAQLAAINTNLAGDYALAGPLSLQGFVFTDAPIAHDAANQFTGDFEGLGNSISGLVITQTLPEPQTLDQFPSNGFVGLFGVIGAGGVVRDLSLIGASVSGGDAMSVGALAGANLGSILNASSSGAVTVGSSLANPGDNPDALAGGLIGIVEQGGSVSGSSSSATVTGGDAIAGGLVGGALTGAVVTGSSASGSVTVGDFGPEAAAAGGLAGIVYGYHSGATNPIQVMLANDDATGAVAGGAGALIGGFVGLIEQGQVSTSYSTGGVTQTRPGISSVQNDVAGGFVGFVGTGGSVTQSYASGAVATVGGPDASVYTAAGGFAGDVDLASSVTDSYALGSVTATGSQFSRAGGFAGIIQGDASVSGVYATGAVSGNGAVRGLAAEVGSSTDPAGAGGSISDAYWDKKTTGQTGGYALAGSGSATHVGGLGGVLGPSPYEKASYAKFNFRTVWYLIPGQTRPILRSEYSTTIDNAHQLQLMDLDVSADYTIGADIDASETSNPSGVWNVANGFSPIGENAANRFLGTLDGQGHTITGLTVIDPVTSDPGAANPPAVGYAGLFGVVGVGGVVENLVLTGADIASDGGAEAGIAVGRLLGTISNVETSGVVQVGSSVLIAGPGQAGQVTAESIGGGLVGDIAAGGVVTGSSSSASVTGGSAEIGGLAGAANPGAAISNSFATGAVTVGSGVLVVNGDNSEDEVVTYAGGLVGLITGGEVHPVTVEGSHATGSVSGGDVSSDGGLVGSAFDARISGSYATGDVTGGAGSDLGGFAGFSSGPAGQINTSYATGAVSDTAGSNGTYISQVGGFIGYSDAPIVGSYSSGPVTIAGRSASNFNAGGFVGIDFSGITDSYSLSSVDVEHNTTPSGGFDGYTGGFAGVLGIGGTLQYFYATGRVAGNDGQAGGLIGALEENTDPTSGGAVVADGYWDQGTTQQTVAVAAPNGNSTPTLDAIGGATGSSPYAASSYSNFLDFGSTWYLIEGETRPILRSEYSTTITNAHQLELMGLDPGADYTLANNIDASETSSVYGVWNPANGFVPVGSAAAPFTGQLHGQGFTISNLDVVVAQGAEQTFDGLTTDGFAGLFGVVNGPSAIIESVNLAGVNVSGGDGVDVGGLAGALLQGAIENDTSSGVVTGGDALIDANGNRINTAVGGLVGLMGSQAVSAPAAINDSSSSAVVSGGDAFVGGLVGSTLSGSTIMSSFASGAVTVGDTTGTTGEIAAGGGLVGSIYGASLEGDHATGSVTGSGGSTVGGFAGYVGGPSLVLDSYATGAVAQAATSFAFSDYAGGFAGYVDTGSSLAGVFARGAVNTVGAGSAPSTFAGGFAGYVNGAINQAYATGAVASASLPESGAPTDNVGGFAGEIDSGGVVNQVYATGAVTGAGSVGGLSGKLAGALSSSYWDEGTTGQTVGFVNAGGSATTVVGVGGATGISPYEAATYAGWDFGQAWSPPSAGEYPELLGVSNVIEVVGGPTASVYGQYPVYTYQILGLTAPDLQFGESPNGVKSSTAGWIDVGTYALDLSNTSPSGAVGDARLIFLPGSLTVTPAPVSVTLTGVVEKTYDGTTGATIAAGNLNLSGVLTGDLVSGSAGSSVYADKNAGMGIEVTATGLRLTGADAANYSIAADAASGAVGEIDPKTLTVTLTGTVDKIYDGTTDATLSASNYGLTGMVSGDSVSLNDPTAGAYATKNAGTGIEVTASGLQLTGANKGNYTVASSASGDIGTIDPKALTASLVGTVSKTYDGTAIATLAMSNYQLTGAIPGDTVSLNDPTTGTYASAQAGTGIDVTATGLRLTGADAGDYTVNGSATAAIGVITGAAPVVTPGQVEIQVIAPTQVDTVDQSVTATLSEAADAAADAAGAAGQSTNPTTYTVFPVTQGGRTTVGQDSPVTGAGNGDLWAGSNLDADQTCPSGDRRDCQKSPPTR